MLGTLLTLLAMILIVRVGKETFKDLCDTATMGVKVLSAKTQSWLFQKYKGPEEPNKEEPKKEF